MKRWRVMRITPRVAAELRKAKPSVSYLGDAPLGVVDAPTKTAAITAAMDKFAALGLNASNIHVEEITADLAR